MLTIACTVPALLKHKNSVEPYSAPIVVSKSPDVLLQIQKIHNMYEPKSQKEFNIQYVW